VWADVAELNEVQAKLPTMRELIGLLQQRADQASRELPKFDDSLDMLAAEIAFADRLLQDLVSTLVTKQAMINSGVKPP
jgi:chromosome segregation ATPase